jgi:di/tripeptidase
MNRERLKEVLSIPSVFRREELVRDYITDFAIKNDIKVMVDDKGNLYLTKGETDDEDVFYPCVVAHMDTVHSIQSALVDKDLRLDIVESVYERDEDIQQTILTAKLPGTTTKAGIGGDDKCGVAVCLEMLEEFHLIKAVFFVEEEIGMLGSKEADEGFFKDVGYAIQFDAPSDNWISEVCSGVRLFDGEFKGLITETLSDNGYTSFSNDPFTDVNQLAQKFDFCCLNLGCGYHRQHTVDEYVVVEEVENSVKAGINLIKKLGFGFYQHNKPKPTINEFNTGGSSAPWYDWDNDEEELLEMSENIADSIIEMLSGGAEREDVVEFIYDYLEDNAYY